MMWIDTSVMQLEDRFTGSAIGDQSGSNNQYGLVLFGGQQPYLQRVLVGGNELAPAQQFSDNLRDTLGKIVPTDGFYDGYAALDQAIDTMWRPNSYRMIIFITDKERDIVFPNITANTLITRLVDAQIALNAILDVSMEALLTQSGGKTNTSTVQTNPAYGIVFSNESHVYFTNPNSNNVETVPFGRIFSINATSSILYDYGILPEDISTQVYSLQIPSSIWQLSYTLNNNTMFDEAFFQNKIFEIQTTKLSRFLCQACQGNFCFILAEVLVPRFRADVVCRLRGGQLANIDNPSVLSAIRNVYNDTFWLNGFQNNTNGCLIAVGNNSTTTDCNQLHLALCQFPKSQAIGC